MILIFYIAMRFFRALAAVFLVFFLIYFLSSTAQIYNRFLQFEIELFESAKLALMRIALVLYNLLPIIVGLASLLMSFFWFRSSEMVAVRSAGVSALTSMAVPAGCAFLFGIVSIAFLNPLVAVLTDQYRISTGRIDSSLTQSDWIRNDEVYFEESGGKSDTVVRATLVDENNFEFRDANIFQFGDDGSIKSWTFAKFAKLADSHWQLEDGKIWEISSDRINPEKSAKVFVTHELPTDLTRDQVLASLFSIEFVSIWEIENSIEYRERAGIESIEFKVFFSVEFAKPLFFAALVLVGAGLTTVPSRLGPSSIRALLAAIAVLGFYYFGTFAKVLAENERLPILVAAWVPPFRRADTRVGLFVSSRGRISARTCYCVGGGNQFFVIHRHCSGKTLALGRQDRIFERIFDYFG